jgi:hypothetical protein
VTRPAKQDPSPLVAAAMALEEELDVSARNKLNLLDARIERAGPAQ